MHCLPKLLLIVFVLNTRLVDSQRFYACEPNCVLDKCDDEDEKQVCVHIIEVDPDGNDVEFPNKCAFNCANKCYGNQLRIKKHGKCAALQEIKDEELAKLSGDDEDEQAALPAAAGDDEDEDEVPPPAAAAGGGGGGDEDEDEVPPPAAAGGGDDDEDERRKRQNEV